MKGPRIKHIGIVAVILTAFVCTTTFAFASDSDQDVQINVGNGLTLPAKPIDRDGVKHLFLPSGTTEDRLIFNEGDDISNYETMIDENIGSLHFFSDDPEKMGMRYIHASADHTTKAPGRIVLLDEDLNVEYEGGVEAIKGRGNTTWKRSNKKPYQIKLSKKANLLDLSDSSQKAKKWILLANDFDSTLMRNHIAYSLASEMGLGSTPEGKYVDLYYDGEYRGLYCLCEKVEIGDGRVEIPNPEKSPGRIDGSYLLELDNMYYESETHFRVDSSTGFMVCKEPEEPTREQLDYIADLTREAMACIQNGGRSKSGEKTLFDYFDRDSLVRYFLAMEFAGNEDTFMTSTYMYKPEGEDRFYMGPVWDCDMSMGSARATSGRHDMWYTHGVSEKLMKIREFRQAVQEEYKGNLLPLVRTTLLGQSRGTYLAPVGDIRADLAKATLMNHTAWYLIRDSKRLDYYTGDLDSLEQWLRSRASWLDREIQSENFVEGTTQKTEDTKKTDTTKSTPTVSTAKPTVKPAAKATKEAIVPKLKKPSLKVKAKKRALNVSWGRVKGASGYEIRYYIQKKYKKTVRIKRIKARAINLKKLKKRTRYVVQVRVYCKTAERVYYSPWAGKTMRTK